MNFLQVFLLASALACVSANTAFLSEPVKEVYDYVARCGGQWTLVELRMRNCTGGGYCWLRNGTEIGVEMDFIPIQPISRTSLRVRLCGNTCMTLLDIELPGGIINPGKLHTVHYSAVTPDNFCGKSANLETYVYNTETGVSQICSVAMVDVSAPCW